VITPHGAAQEKKETATLGKAGSVKDSLVGLTSFWDTQFRYTKISMNPRLLYVMIDI
jgi:hypothetical protein